MGLSGVLKDRALALLGAQRTDVETGRLSTSFFFSSSILSLSLGSLERLL